MAWLWMATFLFGFLVVDLKGLYSVRPFMIQGSNDPGLLVSQHMSENMLTYSVCVLVHRHTYISTWCKNISHHIPQSIS